MCSKLLVTGGLGFIGSAFIRFCLRTTELKIVNLDAMTYAANEDNLNGFHEHPRYRFIQGNINDITLVNNLLDEQEIDTIVHFAAETHVDRSITSSLPFVESNVLGTISLLEAVRRHPEIHFHHISTDEVYGSLGESGLFTENSPYRPNSPYSASKAAADHFVRAYAHTYGLSTTISHCTNNYGPGQHREKFIPLMITHCLESKPLPVYGRGANIRDWIYVDDHAEAVWEILQKGRRGEAYGIGGNCEKTNLELLHLLIDILAQETGENYRPLIRFVSDRPGHDYRYAIDNSKIERELGWKPKTKLEDGLRKIIRKFIICRSEPKLESRVK
jgi:dTDP-glucose 4,6-dehydratase